MKRIYNSSVVWTFIILALNCSTAFSQTNEAIKGSKHHYVVKDVKASIIYIDSTYDRKPNKKATAILTTYKDQVQKIMTTVIGTSAETMTGIEDGTTEGLLSNLVADLLRETGTKVCGTVCDMGLINKGGLRTTLPKGNITLSNIYEIMPFDNSLTILTLNGKQLNTLLEECAAWKGQGISGVRMVITKDGKLVSATIGGNPIEENKVYRLATINYLAEGNDGFTVLAEKSIEQQNHEDMILRDIMLNYVKEQTAQGKQITSKLDGRCSFQK
jgi:2',3'-cyclic-nucleotide 2'-phosphodiesterase (5'-nucleotidase family)